MPEIVFSQKISDLLVKHNITKIRYDNGLVNTFKVRSWSSVLKHNIQLYIDEYKGCKVNTDHCIFMVPHPTIKNKIRLYFSELSEKELLQLIKLRLFW